MSSRFVSGCEPPIFTNEARDDAVVQVELVRIAVRSCRHALASPEPFTIWLRSLSRRSVCGRSSVGEASPLAHFLSEKCGRHVRVGRHAALIGGSLSDDTAHARFQSVATLPLPEWARAVEWRTQDVTAGRMLEVVAQVRAAGGAAGVEADGDGQQGTSALLPDDR